MTSTSASPWSRRFRPLLLPGSLLLVILITVLTGPPLQAQSPEGPAPIPGFQHDQAYIGALPFEHIDTGSGNLLLTFTDVALPGYNGMDLTFQRTFNSANLSWTFGLARYPYRVWQPDGPPPVPPTQIPDFYEPSGLPLILTPDGGAHRTWWDGAEPSASGQVFGTAEFWRYHTNGRRLETVRWRGVLLR